MLYWTFLWALTIIGNPAPASEGVPSIYCETQPFTVDHHFRWGNEEEHWKRTVTLRATGRFVEESHYVTSLDEFPDGRLFAESKDENIDAHLTRSLALYHFFDPNLTLEQLYPNAHNKVWTPPEGGKAGQGAIGAGQVKILEAKDELWLVTMMWAKGHKPKPGTKFLMEANGKQVVVVAGFETGPAGQQYLGGITREVHAWLGTNNQSEITISFLKDQTVASGPVTCQ